MPNSEDFAQAFLKGLSYADYLATGTDEQKRRWSAVYESASLAEPQHQLLSGFVRRMNVLVVSGVWCGDCVHQVPLMERIAEANSDKIALRIIDRDVHKELSSQFRVNAGDRVPVVLFLSEDFELCSAFGDRTLTRYRALAAKMLGAACPVGLLPPEAGELNATLADWLNEFERVQWMLRLSPRLRKLHND